MTLRPGSVSRKRQAHQRRTHKRQRGISLIVSLILMVVAALVALGSMRAVQLQTRMSGAAHDRSLAFQAAEAALREAEQRALTAQPADFPALGCTSGFCAEPLLADDPRWLDDAFAGWRTVGPGVGTAVRSGS
ncbi:MAG: PilX N-terminal domain-containing pilus assembly protein [Pseudomonadota bacterium]|nr:PilX N-terminal domain-containing pilus assembly protein [Pseudomonadota bacterium]